MVPPPDTTTAAAPPAEAGLAELADLARGASSPSAFYKRAVAVIGHALAAPCVSMEARIGSTVVQQQWLDPEQDATAWTAPVQRTLTAALSEKRPVARLLDLSEQTGSHAALLAVPLENEGGQIVGALALVAPCDDTEEAKGLHEHLTTLGRICALCPGTDGPQADRRVGSSAGLPAGLGLAGATLKKLAAFEGVTELCFALANNVRNRAGCDVAAFGLVRGAEVHLECLSGCDDVQGRSAAVHALRHAMNECLDQARVLQHPQPTGTAEGNWPLQREASVHGGGEAVVSIPFSVDGVVRAVLLLRREGDAFEPEEVTSVQELVQPYVDGLELVDRAGRGLLRHTYDATLGSLPRALRPANLLRTTLTLGLVAGIAWLVLGRMPFELQAPFRVVPSETRSVAAPFDGTLVEARLQPGDRFAAGDVLLTFDTRSLELERQKLEAEIGITRLEERQALAADDALGMQLAERRRASLAASLDVVEHSIARAVVHAPFDGIVLEGDLRPRVGDGAAEGEPLLQLARSDAFELELAVKEGDAVWLREAMGGEFSPTARPEERRPLELLRIDPALHREEGDPALRAHARAVHAPEWLRPGMEGMARLSAGERAPWWVLSRKALDSLRLRFWL